MKFVDEFKKFALRGNAIDLAVGIVIGTAFGAITQSLVKDIINPFIGALTGGIDFSDKVFVLKEATETATAITINYGVFINTLINFLIVALALFIVIKQINRLERQEKPTEPTEKKCPYCTMNISLHAKRCPHCTSELS